MDCSARITTGKIYWAWRLSKVKRGKGSESLKAGLSKTIIGNAVRETVIDDIAVKRVGCVDYDRVSTDQQQAHSQYRIGEAQSSTDGRGGGVF